MASLDNFHTGNPVPHPSQRRGQSMYPYHLSDRHLVIQRSLMGNDRDVTSRVPIAPIQPHTDPLLQTGRAAPDPTYVEVMSSALNDSYVATRPRTHMREAGDTAEYKMLIQTPTCIRNRLANWVSGGGDQRSCLRLNTYSRYHPYLGR